jgi:hypothetical protein
LTESVAVVSRELEIMGGELEIGRIPGRISD